MSITLSINGESYTISPEDDLAFYSPTTTLADFIRTKTPWTSTKVACGEGGCNACCVALTTVDNVTNQPSSRPINSCLAILWSLDGAAVTTNDGFGNSVKGLTPQQTALAKNNGFQCSYCTSGMLSLLTTHLKANPDASEQELLGLLDGSICRCAAYSGIVKTYKSFAKSTQAAFSDQPTCMKENCCQKRNKAAGGIDIENCTDPLSWDEVDSGLVTKHQQSTAKDNVSRLIQFARAEAKTQKQQQQQDPTLPPSYDNAVKIRQSLPKSGNSVPYLWLDCNNLQDLANYYNQYKDQKPHIIKNFTSAGIYHNYRMDEYEVFLHITNSIQEMQGATMTSTAAKIGANCIVNDVISFLNANSTSAAPAGQQQVFSIVAKHLGRIAGYSIRNRASIAGNLALAKKHSTTGDSFPSDAATALLGAEAQLVVFDLSSSSQRIITLEEYYNPSVDGETTIILQVLIPVVPPATLAQSDFYFRTYKIAIRQVMDHAIVNASMSAQIGKSDGKIKKFVCVLGGCFPAPTRVSAVESMLVGADPTSPQVFQAAASALKSAVTQGIDPTEGRVQYRIQTAQNYLYKFFLTLQGSKLNPNLEKAAQQWMIRDKVTETNQSYPPADPALAPVGIAMPKLDANTLACGEAAFTADRQVGNNTLYAAPVLTQQAKCPIVSIDKTAGSVVNSFVRFFGKDDVKNNSFMMGPTELFASKTSDYACQLVGIAVAGSQQAARLAAKKISDSIVYGPQTGELTITVDDCVKNQTFFRPGKPDYHLQEGDASKALSGAAKTFSGSVYAGSQYHFHLENHVTIVTPVGDEVEVECCSQAISACQEQVATTLQIPTSSVQVKTRRCGGGFGAKATSALYTSASAAVAARALRREVKLEMTSGEGMAALGARSPYRFDYHIGVDANNKIVALTGTMYIAVGASDTDCGFEPTVAVPALDNVVQIPNADVSCFMMKSDTKPNTSVRGPGWISAICMMEELLNNTARDLKIDPTEFRRINLHKMGDPTFAKMPISTNSLSQVWDPCYTVFQQAVKNADALNAKNKFYKRGVAMSGLRFPVVWNGMSFQSMVAIYPDGTVAITTGGVEIGQGIHAKIQQVCARYLGLTEDDLPTFRMIANNTSYISTGNVTGGSVTSELCALSIMQTCQELSERLSPYRHEGQTWKQLVSAALADGVDLTARGTSGDPGKGSAFRYNVWGCACAQVDVDGLTGQFELRQVDLHFDVGRSLNPDIDLGQVEGGFFFGLGAFTMEECLFDTKTGMPKTASSWEYKPVTAFEVPETFNVSLIPNSENQVGVLSSKACGEPPLALAMSVVNAIEDAVNKIRAENTSTAATPWSCTSTPLTVDKIAAACAIPTSALSF